MPADDPLALVGTTVSEKYEVQSVVGEGGFAVVYRARHTVFNRPVALKVFRALGDLNPSRRKELLEDFIQEGRVLADLSERSAAICQARDIGMLRLGDGRDIPYMVLEWLEGRSLEEVIVSERGTPPRAAEAVVRILEPAAEALALAHRKGIVHRDVKPANIFILGDLRDEFSVKLLDFGIAKVVQDAQQANGGFSQTQGVVSSFTPAYGAPEQYSRAHGPTGPWTDVFALALIFTELMTHQAPLQGDDITQLAFSAMDTRQRPTPRTYGAAIPDLLESVFLRALAVSPKDRFQSMGEFWEALRSALSMETTRAFGSTDSSGSGRMHSGSLVPSSGSGSRVAGSPSRPIAFDATQARPSSQPTLDAPTGAVAAQFVGHHADRPTLEVAAGRQGNGTPLALIVGAGVIGILAAGALGFRVFRHANPVKTTSAMPAPTASASAPPPVVARPPPTCPQGMTKIPGGKFFMGSDDRKDNARERPSHQVILSPYCMDTTEVTVDQYRACSDKGECKRGPLENEWDGIDAAAHKLYDPLCNVRDPQARGNHPMNCIDWELATAFCTASGKRLPTEAEWEYATRGSDGRKYPWGDDPPTNGTFLNACGKECVAWGRKHPDPDNPLVAMYSVDDGYPTTAPVGSFPKGASPFGLQDVVGNVWEWVSDWYAPYGADATVDPKGAPSGEERVLRGGSWNGSDVAWVRPTYRFKTTPTLRSHGIGMRCAMTLPTTPPSL